jgi:protein-L-isoaspartate(D-aspartate) O-methyltransferase
MSVTPERARMVEHQLRRRGLLDPNVLACMARVPRELFVPEETRGQAYDDGALAIGEGQTISQPFMVARTLELAAPKPTDRALEIGAGSGYQAAVLGCLCREVITVERIPALVERARQNLRVAGVANVRVEHADGTLGWPAGAPYDCIVVAAAAPRVPEALVAQLAPGGRLIIPVGERHVQDLLRVVKQTDGTLHQTAHEACVFVPLLGAQGWPDRRSDE